MSANNVSDTTIRIDLSKSCDVTRFDNEAFLQKEAYKRFNELLGNSIGVAKDFDNITDEKEKKYKFHVHNAIFVGGARGSGKTTFLVNVDRGMDKGENKSIRNDCLFLDIIDPTLLHNNEKFLSIVLGLLANYVDKHQECVNDCSSGNCSNNGIQEFYKNLQNAASAMETIENGKCSGIDAMIANQNGLQLEDYLNKVYSLFLKLFNKKLIVIRIDDIDMSFHHGYAILETIRKHLSSPYILPVICGDMKQYRLIVEREFASNGEYPKFNKDGTDDDLQRDILPDAPDEDFLKRYQYLLEHRNIPESITDGRINQNKYAGHIVDLAEKYLIKVFPKNKRINLHSDIINLLKKNGYTVLRSKNNVYIVPLEKLFELELELRHYRIERNYDSNHDLPNNVRELFQYLNSQMDFYATIMSYISADEKTRYININNISDVKSVWAGKNYLRMFEEKCETLSAFLEVYKMYLLKLIDFIKFDITREQLYLECKANLNAIVQKDKSLTFDYKTLFVDDTLKSEYGFLTPYGNPYFKVPPEYVMIPDRKTRELSILTIILNNMNKNMFVNEFSRLAKFFLYSVSEENYYSTNAVMCMPFSGRLITHIIDSITAYSHSFFEQSSGCLESTDKEYLDTLTLNRAVTFIDNQRSFLKNRPYLCELSRTKVSGILDDAIEFGAHNDYYTIEKSNFINNYNYL